MSIFIKNARILTMDDQFTEFEKADLLVEGTKISRIGENIQLSPEMQAEARTIDASGKLLMPGLVNGHIHSPGNFSKGTLDNLPLEVFMLYEVPPLSENPPNFRMNYVRTMLSNMEMLKLGITAVHDDAFYVPYPTPDAIDGLMQSYADSGMRVAASIDQPNIVEYEKYPYLYDLLPQEIREQMENAPRNTTEELLEFYQHLIEKWHKSYEGRIGAAVSVSAPQRVTVDYFEALSELSKKHDLPFDIHILETKLQRVLGQEKFGKSLVKYVHDLGFLDERVMVIHAIWVDDEDLRLMADAGVSVAHNPICNLRLGSGVMQWRKLHDYGIPICMGSDEGCTDDTANMWLVGKMAGLIHSLTDPDYNQWPKAKEVLRALIRGGARAMRNEGRVGVLASGYEADLIMVDLNTLNFTPLNDLHRQLVYNEDGSSVRMTMVAGQIVAENGKLLTVDEEAIKAEARELMKQYRLELEKCQLDASRLEPYYRAMYLRAAEQDVGMNRWVRYRE